MGYVKIFQNEKAKFNGQDFPKMIFFTGKGGVGKTTCASLFGKTLANQQNRVLIVSTDPAHSLGDSFRIKLKPGEIVKISDSTLYVVELSFKEKGYDGQKSKINFFSEILFPTSEEFSILYEVSDLLVNILNKNNIFDYILFDMAPSGHTLRVLNFPNKLKTYLRKIYKLNSSINKVRHSNNSSLTKNLGSKRKIQETIIRLKVLLKMLRSPSICQFILVGIPEYLSYIESVRTFEALNKIGIHCNNYILNKIETLREDEISCLFCSHRIKKQKEITNLIKNHFQGLNVLSIPLKNLEIDMNRANDELHAIFQEIL
ncbi:MAG: AAA family ATPase [Candidatus Lokiarchaeota archaeon]|nr:AAA family ATPase [Candidatus Lokiarchaeota archaeon]